MTSGHTNGVIGIMGMLQVYFVFHGVTFSYYLSFYNPAVE